MIIIGIIEILIADVRNPHHYPKLEKQDENIDYELMRVEIFTALAIVIHNFSEGIATFGSALVDVKLGIVITFAIALHNILEDISVSMPILFATGDKKKVFIYSFLSDFQNQLNQLLDF